MAISNLQQLYARVYALLENNTEFYREQEVRKAILNGLRWLNLCTGFYRITVPIILQPGQWLYNLPSQILHPIRVATDIRQLERVSLSSIGRDNRNWMHEMENGGSGKTEFWASFGAGRILIGYPPENHASTAYVDGIAEPSLPSGLLDMIDLPADYYDWLIHYAAADCMLKCGGIVADASSAIYSKLASEVPAIIQAQQRMKKNIRAEIREPMSR